MTVDDLARTSAPAAGGPLRRLAAPLGVAALALGATSVLAVVDPSEPGHYPTCPFLFLTGLYCPGCGSMRAIHALTDLDVLAALERNPFTVVAAPLLVLAWAGWTRRRLTGRPQRTMLPAWTIWTLLAGICAFWVLRNVPGFEWLAP